MVATRSGRGAKAPEVMANTNNTLKAPPKRAGKRKAVEDAPAEPAPKVLKPMKAEPKKVAPKTATKAAPKAAVKTTRHTAKAVEAVEQKPEPQPVIETKAEEPKTIRKTVRGRKPAVTAPVVEAPVVIEAAKELEMPVVAKEPVVEPLKAVEKPVKPTARARKQPAPKGNSRTLLASVLSTRATTTRTTRGRNAAVAPLVESPLKAPARKPGRKPAAKAALKAEPENVAVPVAVEEPFTEYPTYPTTPAHITAPLSSRAALRELPVHYPKTPTHISAPISHKDAIAELPGYPKTPAHITAAFSNQKALNELPAEYPKTPAHAAATLSSLKALNELPAGYPKTPAHITNALHNHRAFNELPADYPKTPVHIVDAYSNQKAFDEMPEYPKTPAHIEAALGNQKALDELPVEYPRTPAHVATMLSNQRALNQLPDYPQTPAHIAAPLANQDALKELPAGYPQTPAHIRAPMTIQEGLAALPSYPNTPKAIGGIVEEAASSPVQESEPEDMSFELTGPILEIQPELSLIDSDGPPLVPEARNVHESSMALSSSNVVLAAPEMVNLAAPASPGKRSALRSPAKFDLKTPKKTVTWNDNDSEPDFLLHGGPLRGMKFFVDITSNGKDQSFLFTSLLEDMGAHVERSWNEDTSLTHVLFKDGKKATLEKVVASKGVIKCVNVGWILDSEKNKERMDEAPYLVDLAPVNALSPLKSKIAPFTPAKTPSKYLSSLQEKSSSIKSVPSTPTSSEFDRSINFDEKENSELGIFFTPQVKTCPKPKKSWLLNKSAMKTPSKFEYLKQTPLKAFSTTKKRTAMQSFGSISMAPPKKLLFL